MSDKPRRWTTVHNYYEGRKFGSERLPVREDRVTDADLEAVAEWLRTTTPEHMSSKEIAEELLSLVLGSREDKP